MPIVQLNKKWLLSLLLLVSTAFAKPICIFNPPSKWECVAPSLLAKEVLVGFVSKGQFLNLSLNLATEPLEISFSEYLKTIKALHASEKIIDLGEIETLSGKCQLFSLQHQEKNCTISMLQAILPYKNEVFVLTAAAGEKDLLKHYKTFLAVIKSLQVVEDLFSAIPDEKQRHNLQELLQKMITTKDRKQKEKLFDIFKNNVANNFQNLGTYWQMLMLAEGNFPKS